jgi:hypothetical protein
MTKERAKDLQTLILETIKQIENERPGSLTRIHEVEELLEAGIKMITISEQWNSNA